MLYPGLRPQLLAKDVWVAGVKSWMLYPGLRPQPLATDRTGIVAVSLLPLSQTSNAVAGPFAG